MLLQQQAVGMEELLFLTAIGKFLSFPFLFENYWHEMSNKKTRINDKRCKR